MNDQNDSDLKRFINKSFSKVNKKFDLIDRRFNQSDRRFDLLVELLLKKEEEVKNSISGLEERLELRFDGVFTKMDAVYKELIAVRQEQAAHAGSHIRIDEQLDGHDKRIQKLESVKVAV